MDLETFIAETLRQIVKGIKTAQEHEDCKGAKIVPFFAGNQGNRPEMIKQIEFDVAVTVSEGSDKQGKGSIGIASYFGVGGQATSSTANTSVSRIKFEIPVRLPATD